MCPDIWRSLTLNSRYASPVKKKGNAEKSEACVDLGKKSSSHPSYRKTIFNISQISLSLRSTEKKNVRNYIYIYIIIIPKILKYRSQYSSILSHFSSYNYILPKYSRRPPPPLFSRQRKRGWCKRYQRLWRPASLEHPQPRARRHTIYW